MTHGMTTNLWKEVNYNAPIDYIIDGGIIEYDISKANISILYEAGHLTQSEYLYYFNAPKEEREVAIGKRICRNNELSDILKQGIEDARCSLFQILSLDQTNVLAIKNDAVFVIKNGIVDYPDTIQISPHIAFKHKGEYRSFYRFKHKQLFYTINPIMNTEGMSIKGLGDYAINLHSNYLISWFMYVFRIAIISGSKAALAECDRFMKLYINRELPIEYYRRFDSAAMYDFRVEFSPWSQFSADFLTEGMAEKSISIDYNLDIISSLARMYINEIIKGSN